MRQNKQEECAMAEMITPTAVRLDVSALSMVNYALQQNRVSVIRSVSIKMTVMPWITWS